MAKGKKGIRDPFASREAGKYEHPIPSREFILQYLEEYEQPIKYEQLSRALCLQCPEEQEGLRRRLRAMVSDGQLVRNRRNYYCLPQRMQLLPGRVIGHKDGFGFVVPDDGSDDLFLTPRNMRLLFDGDRVLVRVASIDARGRREADLVEVLERHNKSIVGRFCDKEGAAFIVPDNVRISQDIFIKTGAEAGAQDGQIVIAEIIDYPTNRNRAVAQIVEVLGEQMAPNMEVDIAIRVHDLPHEWPEAVLAQIADLDDSVSEAAKQDREDLRALPLVTIDGEDAKDFDDAVYCRRNKRGDGWKLWVAIADVSHYVKPGSALDQEALQRGTSVYFPGRVLPMLPELLSNTLCSLQPNVDRLCVVCEMSISAEGKLTRHRFYPAVMRSHARLTYTQVGAVLAGETGVLDESLAPLVPHLFELHQLYQALRGAREARGAIDFDRPETQIIFGEDKKIDRIVPVVRNDAHRLIEECMLMANVATAKFLQKAKLSILYRVHEGPSADRLAEVKAFLAELGLNLPGGDEPEPADYSKLLQSIGSRADSTLIQTVLLRSLSQAVYSPDNKGHFGLAFSAYTHFTSPIRRYPDLLVHRAIYHILAGGSVDNFVAAHRLEQSNTQVAATPREQAKQVMHDLGEHCSAMERRADDATRDAVAWLKCEFMLAHVGSEFSGIVNAVTSFGIFVELDEFYIEGLVHVTALRNDYYQFDPLKRRLYGTRTGTSYRLGDKIQIRVVRVNLDDKKIDFELVEQGKMASTGKPKPKAKSKPKPKSKPKAKSTANTKKSKKSKPKGKAKGKRATAKSRTNKE